MAQPNIDIKYTQVRYFPLNAKIIKFYWVFHSLITIATFSYFRKIQASMFLIMQRVSDPPVKIFNTEAFWIFFVYIKCVDNILKSVMHALFMVARQFHE